MSVLVSFLQQRGIILRSPMTVAQRPQNIMVSMYTLTALFLLELKLQTVHTLHHTTLQQSHISVQLKPQQQIRLKTL